MNANFLNISNKTDVNQSKQQQQQNQKINMFENPFKTLFPTRRPEKLGQVFYKDAFLYLIQGKKKWNFK